MIDKSFLKSAVGICFAVSLIAGCSSSKTSDDAAAGSDPYGDSTVVESVDDLGTIDSDSLGGGLAALDNIYYFEFDTSELSPDLRARLDETASALRSKSGLVRLEGHADERGTREYNLALGERRAKAVANYLAIQGVPNSQMETISYGEEKPAAIGLGDSAWAQNRRVELIYID
jgi:peptidoglycan-associated lipoprotein